LFQQSLSSCVLPQLPANSTVIEITGIHELLWECAHIQLEIVHVLTFSQQGVFFPACLPARTSCNMWDQSTGKLIEEVEKRPALYFKSMKEYSDTNHKKKWEEVGTALIENWNGLAPEEKKNLKAIIYTSGSYNLHKLRTVLYVIL
jgi:hypothetical protein